MQDSKYSNRIVTIPNVLSFIRILMIPVFLWLYCARESSIGAAVVALICGLSDGLDGWIARKYHMESALGRILDPVAGALAQLAMCAMLAGRYPVMLWTLAALAVRILAVISLGYRCVRRGLTVTLARWYGNACGVTHYIMVLALILFPGISAYLANVLNGLLLATHILTLALYVASFSLQLSGKKQAAGVALESADSHLSIMYLLLMLALFLLLFTRRENILKSLLPKPVYLFVQFGSIVGTIGVPAFFLGEMLPRSIFKPNRFPFKCYAWEHDGQIYDKIGIQWWKTHTPDMSRFIQQAFPKQGNFTRDPEHLRKLVVETCSAEFVHWVLIFLSPVFVVLMDDWGIIAMILYILGNMISLVIQRYNRPRIQKIIDRIEKRKCAVC